MAMVGQKSWRDERLAWQRQCERERQQVRRAYTALWLTTVIGFVVVIALIIILL